MDKVWFVAQRDIKHHLRRKDFYWSTFGVPLVGVIIFVVARLLGGDPSGQTTMSGIVGEASPAAHTIGYVNRANAIISHTAILSPTQFQEYADLDRGEQALRDETISTLFFIPSDYVNTGIITRTTRSASLFGGGDVDDFAILLSANALQTADPALATRLNRPFTIGKTTALSTAVRTSGSLNNVSSALVPILFAMTVYFSIFMGASLLMQGVLEEKENRTLEVLMTSISPRQLLAGKIIGLGIVALLQLLIWSAIGGLALRNSANIAAIREVNLPWTVWALMLAFFIFGYLLYASLMAGIGAISPSMRELSQLALLVSIPSAIPVLFLPIMLGKPNGTLAIVLSIVPFTAPSTMMMRQTLTAVPGWQTALSLALLALAVVVTLNLTARLFRASTLLIGAKITLREVWRALR